MSLDSRIRTAASVLMSIALLASAACLYSNTRTRIPRWVRESPTVRSWIDEVRVSRSTQRLRVPGYNHVAVIGTVSDAAPGREPQVMPRTAFWLCDLIVLERQFKLRSDSAYVNYDVDSFRDAPPLKGESWVIHMHSNAKGDWYVRDMMRAPTDPNGSVAR